MKAWAESRLASLKAQYGKRVVADSMLMFDEMRADRF
jgi:hypothetical protein